MADGSAASSATVHKGSAASGADLSHSVVSKPFDRALVEGCFNWGSLLQKGTEFFRGCRVVPITKDDAFASDAGVRKCMEHLHGPTDTFWLSARCSGGSAWQFMNWQRGLKTVAKIKLHWKHFKSL